MVDGEVERVAKTKDGWLRKGMGGCQENGWLGTASGWVAK